MDFDHNRAARSSAFLDDAIMGLFGIGLVVGNEAEALCVTQPVREALVCAVHQIDLAMSALRRASADALIER